MIRLRLQVLLASIPCQVLERDARMMLVIYRLGCLLISRFEIRYRAQA